MNGIYSFHASTAAYAEFWTNSYGKSQAFKIQRRQIWQAFTTPHDGVELPIRKVPPCSFFVPEPHHH